MKYRTLRISEEVKKELSIIIQNEIKDPRVPSMVSVMKVDVTKDQKYAKAYIGIMGTEDEKKQCIEALNSAKGYIRHEIGRRVIMRMVPDFVFIADDTLENGMKIDRLLKQIEDERIRNNDEQ